MKIAELLESIQALAGEHPDVVLVKNQVGNLAILDSQGEYVGYVDLQDGSHLLFVDEPD